MPLPEGSTQTGSDQEFDEITEAAALLEQAKGVLIFRYAIDACTAFGLIERWAGLVQAMSRDMNLSLEEADQRAPSSIPMGRIAEVEEVANLVVMLASPLMHMVNGTQIEIDGGQEKSLMDRLRDRK